MVSLNLVKLPILRPYRRYRDIEGAPVYLAPYSSRSNILYDGSLAHQVQVNDSTPFGVSLYQYGSVQNEAAQDSSATGTASQEEHIATMDLYSGSLSYVYTTVLPHYHFFYYLSKNSKIITQSQYSFSPLVGHVSLTPFFCRAHKYIKHKYYFFLGPYCVFFLGHVTFFLLDTHLASACGDIHMKSTKSEWPHGMEKTQKPSRRSVTKTNYWGEVVNCAWGGGMGIFLLPNRQ